ncbi:MAG TPA: 5'-methylthioadenosine/adenosylhomocysteine nucleosidase [Burkholderiaceae bacterium]|nr:5'-methylthioadenosine/adenosylhomocysteine nucleosidase [Burkholderiaceae bacterium]
MTIAIIAALPEELGALLTDMSAVEVETVAGRQLHRGRFGTTPGVAVLSGIGKVAAALTATLLIERYDVTDIVFVGVAGAADPRLRIGDVVVASEFVQHDMDASPLFERFEVPLTGRSRFAVDASWHARLTAATHDYLTHDFAADIDADTRHAFGLARPAVHAGLIASGDEFVNAADRVEALRAALPGLLAVEMEGAAVAQVCDAYAVCFAALRTISDTADHAAATDFPRFIEHVAGRYAHGIVRRLFGMPA